MDANLNNKLPQEGTGCSAGGESLGESSGSSCPSYSGGGKDRSRHGTPRKEETKKAPEVPATSRSCGTNSISSESTTNEDSIVWGRMTDLEVQKCVTELQFARFKVGNTETQVSSVLEEHLIEGAVVVEKIAAMADPTSQLTLNNAALMIKKLLVPLRTREAKRIETRSKLVMLRDELVEKTEMVRRSQEMKDTSNVTSSESNKNPVEQDERSIKIEEELKEMVEALQSKKIEDQLPFLQKYMLDSLAIVKKVATVARIDTEKFILENAATDVKKVTGKLVKLSRLAEKKQKQKQDVSARPKRDIDFTSNIANSAQFTQRDDEKLTNFCKKYLQTTINAYLDSCEGKLLKKWEADSNKGKHSNQGVKKEIDSRALSTREPIYDVWYEMDQFKKFAMKRIEKDAGSKIPQEWFSDSCDHDDEDTEQDEVRLLREQPFWWTSEIAELRRVYMIARRQYSKSRRRRQHDEALEIEHYAAYRSLKKALKSAIMRANSEENDEDSDDSK